MLFFIKFEQNVLLVSDCQDDIDKEQGKIDNHQRENELTDFGFPTLIKMKSIIVYYYCQVKISEFIYKTLT